MPLDVSSGCGVAQTVRQASSMERPEKVASHGDIPLMFSSFLCDIFSLLSLLQ